MNKSILNHIFGILLFLLPFSFPFLIWNNSSFINGSFSVWSSYFLHFQDLILFTVILIGLFLIQKNKILLLAKISKSIYVILFLSLILTFFVEDSVLHFLGLLHFFIMIFAFSFLQTFQIKWNIIGKYLLLSMIFITILAIAQMILQRSIGFSFLGEPEINKNILGVAKINLELGKMIRSYGTFLHPNILSFFSIISFYIADHIGYKRSKWFFIISLLLSFSRGAWLAFVASYILFKRHFSKKELIFTLLGFGIFGAMFFQAILARLNIFDSAIIERLFGVWSSVKILIMNPLGIGIGNFTLYLQEFSENILAPWAFQPVHNFYLLFGNELGIISLGFLIYFLSQVWKKCNDWQKPILFCCLFLGFFDHYLWTSYDSRTLFFFLLFSFYYQKRYSE